MLPDGAAEVIGEPPVHAEVVAVQDDAASGSTQPAQEVHCHHSEHLLGVLPHGETGWEVEDVFRRTPRCVCVAILNTLKISRC